MKKCLSLILLLCCLSGCGIVRENVSEARDDKMIIALLDTGVSTAAIDEKQLLSGWNYVRNCDDTEDRINHGTAVASVILGSESAGVEGLAPNAFIVPLVVTDKTEAVESVSPETLAEAIRDSVDQYNADIINLSLGIKKDVAQVKTAVEYAEEKGVLVVCAAGNEGESEELYYPAAYETVLCVGSHNKHKQVSDFTQKNETVDILAPGEDIWLASRNGKTYGARGTSYATGYVSAAAALVWGNNPVLTPKEIRQILLEEAYSVGGWKVLHQNGDV